MVGLLEIKMEWDFYPERNSTTEIETDFSEEELVEGINGKKIKILGKYLADSKQVAVMQDGIVTVFVS